MSKKKVTFLINENLYDSFKNYCENEEVVISDKIEILLANHLRKEGVNIKEYPTLTSIFTRLNNGITSFPRPEKPIYLEPKPVRSELEVKDAIEKPKWDDVVPAGQDQPMKSFEAIIKGIAGTTNVVNPKRIVSSRPTPTLDQLRTRLGR